MKSFLDPFIENFKGQENVGIVQVNVEESKVKVPLLWVMRPMIRSKVPKELQSNYITCYKDLSEQRIDSGMTNTVLGWVNLVDQYGRIRWQAQGEAKDHEIQSMKRLTQELLSESK